MESMSSHGRAREQLLGHQMRSTCFVAKQTTSAHCSSSKPRRRTTTTRASARKFKMKPSKSNRCEMKQTRKKMSLLLLMLMLLVKSINVFASAGNQTELRPSSAETTTTMLKVLSGGNNGDLLSIEKAIRSRDNNNNNKLAGNNDTTAISSPEQTLEMPMRLRQQLASLAAENMAARAREATQDKDEDEETRRRRKEKEQFLKFLSTTNFQGKFSRSFRALFSLHQLASWPDFSFLFHTEGLIFLNDDDENCRRSAHLFEGRKCFISRRDEPNNNDP